MSSMLELNAEAAVAEERWQLDPLEEHELSVPLLLDELGVLRLVLVASEAGARFQREACGDAMTWMIEPNRIFHGSAPIEACTSLRDCARGILVHGLGLDPDIDLAAFEALGFSQELP